MTGAKVVGLDIFSNPVYGLEDEELVGLNLVDRKRMRGGTEAYDIMNTAGGFIAGDPNKTNKLQLEVTLSETDCVTSSNNVWLGLLGKLASSNDFIKLELPGVREFPVRNLGWQ